MSTMEPSPRLVGRAYPKLVTFGLTVSLLAACATRYHSEEEFRDAIKGVVSPNQTSVDAAAALKSIGFECHSGYRDSTKTLCLRDAQAIPCKQYQSVVFFLHRALLLGCLKLA